MNNNNEHMANTAHKVRAGKLTKSLLVRADDSGQLPSEIEILQTGMWDAPYHGMFMITRDDLVQYIDNYKNNVRPNSNVSGLPIDAEHVTDGGARGWMKDPYIVENADGSSSLWMKTEWTSLGKDELLGGIYKFFSPEFCPDGYMDPEGIAEDCDNVLLGGGLTNRPLFKNLTPVMASDGTKQADDESKIYISIKEKQTMTLDEIRVKDAASLTDEEKQVLIDNKAELSDDERTKFDLVETPAVEEAPVETTVETPAPTVEETTVEEVAPVAAPVAVAASDNTNVVLSASEVQQLKDMAAKGMLAEKQLERENIAKKIDGLVFSATDGIKVKTDQRDTLVDLYVSCSDSQRTQLEEVLKNIPASISASDFTQVGTDQEAPNDASAYTQLKAEADKIVSASNGKTTFSQALIQASDAKPELAKAYYGK